MEAGAERLSVYDGARTGRNRLGARVVRDSDGRSLFTAEKDARGNRISALGYKFIAGVLRHLPAICAVVAPTVNSYKRLIIRGSTSGFTWAPVFVCYGGNNRTNTVRVPLAGGRVELRVADSASRGR